MFSGVFPSCVTPHTKPTLAEFVASVWGLFQGFQATRNGDWLITGLVRLEVNEVDGNLFFFTKIISCKLEGPASRDRQSVFSIVYNCTRIFLFRVNGTDSGTLNSSLMPTNTPFMRSNVVESGPPVKALEGSRLFFIREKKKNTNWFFRPNITLAFLARIHWGGHKYGEREIHQ